MTTPEHTLVGIHLALSLGVHRSYGWTVVAMAGVASNIPDWDGLPMLIDMQRFERGHRVWGHNILAIVTSSVLLAWSQSRFRWLENAHACLIRILPTDAKDAKPVAKVTSMIYATIATLVQAMHLPCDMVVSGGGGLSDWYVKPFWPFSDAAYIYPLIPWGDVGPTIVLMGGTVLVAKFPHRIAAISPMTLLSLCVYLLVRSCMKPFA